MCLCIRGGGDGYIHTSHCLSTCVCHLILRGNRQSASQPEHDLESEITRQGTKCVTWAQSFFLSLKTWGDTDSGGLEKGSVDRGESEGFYQLAALRS